MKTARSFFQVAQDTWPEDEASAVADLFISMSADYPEDPADNAARLRKDCARMERFFMAESDGAELVKRFRAEIARITSIDVTPGALSP